MESLTQAEIEKGKKSYIGETYSENKFKRQNMFLSKPKGIIIMDTWNNKVFPMKTFQVDTMGFDTNRIKETFHQFYGGSRRDLFLPWHYTIDLVDEIPFVVNTRPFSVKSGFKGYENYLTIMIIGDSSKDIYSGKFYQSIAHIIINQFFFFQQFRINDHNNIIYWTKDNFKKNELEKELQM